MNKNNSNLTSHFHLILNILNNIRDYYALHMVRDVARNVFEGAIVFLPKLAVSDSQVTDSAHVRSRFQSVKGDYRENRPSREKNIN